MKLEIQQRKELLIALKDVFPIEGDVKDLAQFALGVHLDLITLAPNLAEKLQDLVTKAENDGSLGMLLEAAIEMRPTDQALQSIRSALTAQIAQEREDHFKTCWLLGDRVMLDRKPLREALKRVNDAQEGKHILVVQGPKLSGKSHSFEMIRYLQQRRGGFRLVWVDIADLVGIVTEDEQRPANDVLRPEELCQALVDQMFPAETMPPHGNEQDTRWVRRFCDWLTGRLANTDTLYWIVLDSFDKTLVPNGVQQLIRELAIRVESNMTQVRLVLLGYKEQDTRDLPERVFGGLEEETLGPITGEELGKELLRSFSQLYERRKQQSQQDFTPQAVADSVAQVMREVDFSSDRYLSFLHKAIIKERKRILA